MTPPGHAALRQLALRMLAHRTALDRPAGAEAIAAAADRAYEDLARVVAPIIGDIGVNALTNRALHLAEGEYTWLRPARERTPAEEGFAHVSGALKAQDAAVATEAAATVFARFLGLLATFIGEPLAMRLARQAWPDALPSAHAEET
jgi:hypothetical protein